MRVERRAAIDVGTNSVKLLVVELNDGVLRPIIETAEQTRLGKGLYQSKRMAEESVTQTAQAVARFARLAADNQVAWTRVIATSAARDALNKDDLLRAIQESSGLPAQIISGDEEAELVFQGVSSDPRFQDERLFIVEVGGGSTQVILGRGQHHSFRQSFPIGGVRLLEELRPADPPSTEDLTRCRGFIAEFLSQQLLPSLRETGELRPASRILVGTGGTASILGRMVLELQSFDRAAIERVSLSRQQVSEWVARLWGLPLVERKKITGMPHNRADVILMGTAIFEGIMEQAELEPLHISTRGLRFGAVLEHTASLFRAEIQH